MGVTSEALTGSSCGYALLAEVKKVTKKGFKAKIKITNTNGKRLDSTGFKVLVRAGAATLAKVGHGTFQAVEGGYLLSSVSRDETEDDCSVDDETPDPDVLAGRAYRFHLKLEGNYSSLLANIIASSGVTCDQTAPSLQLTTSGDFFTSNGTLNLTATASDDVNVAKVVFAQDGVVIGTDTTAPYTLSVPVTSALNGRHRYTATAFDLSGNQGSQTQRALVAIGNKFFGTATTTAADYTGLLAHFDQVTPGNAGKWGSVEATRDVMNFTDLDTAYDFAKQNHLPFKLHTLIWGQQQPAWLGSLTPGEQLAEIEQWMSALAARYPNVDLIDVVNEPLHAPPSYAAALGGAGVTGWDWVVKAFEMARAHFPSAELLLNDYSILTQASSTQDYLAIVKVLKDRGLIDGIGEQGHFYERAPELSVLTTNLNSLAATGLPLYISELDLNLADDALQANRMRDLFTALWSNPSVLGVTHWGYLQNNVWQPNIYLIRSDGSSRPALTWLDCYRAGGANCTVPPYIPQPHTGTDAGITLQAEEYDSAHALLPAGNVVAFASDGSWFGFSKVVFNASWTTLNVSYANGDSSSIDLTVHLDSLDSAAVATVTLPPTGDWSTSKTVSIPWAPQSAQRDVLVRFNGGGANVDKLDFVAPPAPTRNIVANDTFETAGTNGWFTFNGGALSASAARAHTGSQSLLVSGRANNAPAATDLTSLVTPGKSYPFSLWASIFSSDGASKAINVTQATSCRAADGTVSTSYDWIAGPTTLAGDATWSWTPFSGTVVVPNCTLTQLLVWVEGGAGSDLYVDDVQVLDSSSDPTNLLTDGTFEAGQGAWGGFGFTTLGVVSTASHSGTQSLKGSGMQQNGLIGRDIKALVTPGKKYTATAWVSVGDLAAGSGLAKWQTIQNCNADAGDSFPGLAFITVSNGQWVQVTGTVDLTACTTINKLVLFAGADSGSLYLDDVSLTPLP
ncbi:MAG TPA: endo-1,4-beta-xylanase [Polyangiaceae bacterium]|nr:endo-1,4-beta-xylanase [Polyangiaceae bacterium]